MNNLKKYLNNFLSRYNYIMLIELLDNKYLITAITIMLGLYAALLGPQVPSIVKKLFENVIFKIVVLFFIVVRANKDPQLSLIIAIAYVVILELIQKQEVLEGFTVAANIQNMSGSTPLSNIKMPLTTKEHMINFNKMETMANIEFMKNTEYFANDDEQPTDEQPTEQPNNTMLMTEDDDEDIVEEDVAEEEAVEEETA